MLAILDAYFHVSILPKHRKFLRFAFRGEAYQHRVLPLGLALSPCTFTKCVDAALAPLRLQGIRILNYINDLLILAQSEQAVRHRDVVLAHMKELVKCQKSSVFSTTENHLSRRGVGFDHDAGTSVSCLDRVDPHCSSESPRRPVTHCKAVSETERSVERSSSLVAHQLPRDAGRVSSTETLPPGPKRPPCVDALERVRRDGSVYC